MVVLAKKDETCKKVVETKVAVGHAGGRLIG